LKFKYTHKKVLSLGNDKAIYSMSLNIENYFSSVCPKNIAHVISCLEKAQSQSLFTAWSFASCTYAVSGFFPDEYVLSSQNSSFLQHPVFDLASLTKPLFVNALLLQQKNKHYLEFIDETIINLFKNLSKEPHLKLQTFFKKHPNFTLRHLINHESGFKPWVWMGEKSKTKLLSLILNQCHENHIEQVYSDLNYFLLAKVYESLFAQDNNLNLFWKQQLESLNQEQGTDFYHSSIHCSPKQLKRTIPYFPYEIGPHEPAYQHGMGAVHDTNANILATQFGKNPQVSGHAGLFGSVTDIHKALRQFARANLLKWCVQEKTQFMKKRFVYGLDTPSHIDSSAGVRHWESEKNCVFGHLGFTGTSFWANAQSQTCHALLTNKTASRKASLRCPRFYILEDLVNQKQTFYIQHDGAIQEMTVATCIEMNTHYSSSTTIKWDSHVIPEYHDISPLRAHIGRSLWEKAV
jgi:hypothetical protein